MSWNSLHEIEAWRLAREICKDVWKLVNHPHFRLDSGLRTQMLNSSGSIMDNIAEGYGRGSNAEFRNFVGYSTGSAKELISQLLRSRDRDFITGPQCTALVEKVEQCAGLCAGIIRRFRHDKRTGFRHSS